MSLVVETGEGLIDANTYADVDYATDYLTQRDRLSEWGSQTLVSQEAALIKATDYIDTKFGTLFISSQLTTTQALCFPRQGFDTIPPSLKKATVEYAVRAVVSELLLDETPVLITKHSESIGPISESNEYSTPVYNTKAESISKYPAADLLIAPLLSSMGRVIR